MTIHVDEYNALLTQEPGARRTYLGAWVVFASVVLFSVAFMVGVHIAPYTGSAAPSLWLSPATTAPPRSAQLLRPIMSAGTSARAELPRRYAGADTKSPETATPVANPRLEGFALMLDEGTRQSHSMAENSAFVSGFFKGITNKQTFADLVAGLYFVYKAMEEAFDECQDPAVKALDYPELRRLPSLAEDMEYYFGPNWRTTVKMSPATRKYVERIQEVAATEPQLLIGHQYSRYLGDLFGGQMMSGMAVRSLNLEPGKGVAFYNFQDIPDGKVFINEWYTKLNALGLSQAEKEACVDEANVVFRLNIELFEELEGSVFKTIFQLAWSSLMDRFRG